MNKYKISTITLGILLFVSIIVLFGAISTSQIRESGLNSEIESYKNVFKTDLKQEENYKSAKEANDYYSFAVNYYDYGDFDNVILSCEKSRESSSNYMEGVRELIIEIDNYNDNHFVNYKFMLEEHLKVYKNLYEACEYFESAARCYSNEDYISGDNNLEGHNEKIVLHDDAVSTSNKYLAQYNFDLVEFKK